MQSRSYLLTLNNPKEDEQDKWLTAYANNSDKIRYFAFQRECGEQGTEHFQGYVELLRPTRLNALRRMFGGRIHAEKRRGTRDQAREYCTKEETQVEGPWEFGEFVSGGQGKRNDLKRLRDMVTSGKSDLEIVEELPGPWFKYHRGVDKLRCLSTARVARDINVELYWGDPGTGKTRKAFEENDNAFILDSNWFDGYAGEECLIIDDFRSWIPLHRMKRILDRYPLFVDVKGSRVPARWKKCIITSNHNVDDWWPNANYSSVDKEAIKRRIHKTVHFSSNFN